MYVVSQKGFRQVILLLKNRERRVLRSRNTRELIGRMKG
jgi:hypothetical protein